MKRFSLNEARQASESVGSTETQMTERRSRANALSKTGRIFCMSFVVLLLGSSISFAQQWNGDNNSSAPIWRYGYVGIGPGFLNNPAKSQLEISSSGSIAFRQGNHNRGKLRLWQENNVSHFYVSHALGTEAFYNTYGPGISYVHSIGHKFYVHGGELAAQIGFGGAGTPAHRRNSYFLGNVGIGTNAPQARLHVNGDILLANHRAVAFKDKQGRFSPVLRLNQWNGLTLWNVYGNDISIGIGPESYVNTRLVIKSTGKVGIGTNNPTHKLAVNGTIRAKEIIIDTGWADFVFADDYELKPLEEVEAFIEANGHLPDVPSEDEVKAKGVGLGEMQTTLLQKIEELTLYVIDLKKENQELAARLTSLQK